MSRQKRFYCKNRWRTTSPNLNYIFNDCMCSNIEVSYKVFDDYFSYIMMIIWLICFFYCYRSVIIVLWFTNFKYKVLCNRNLLLIETFKIDDVGVYFLFFIYVKTRGPTDIISFKTQTQHHINSWFYLFKSIKAGASIVLCWFKFN